MGTTYHVRAIVLKREPWRESARLYTFYTREHGKVLAVGRGTRKLLSKLGPHLEPYSAVNLHLARGRRLDTVCGASTARSSEAFSADEARHLAAAFIAEAADQLIRQGERDETMWDLLEAVFADLAVLPADAVLARLESFIWAFMDRLGYRPKLDACIICGRSFFREAVRFLPLHGAAACADCRLPERELIGAVPLPIEGQAPRGLTPRCQGLPAALAFLEARLDRPLATLPAVRALACLSPAPSLR